MIPNKQKSECQSCGISLQKGEGFTYQDNSISCRWAICVKSTASTKEFKKYLADSKKSSGRSINEMGFLTYNPKPSGKALDLINSIPGIKRSGDGWQVSCESKDKRRIIEIADQIGIEINEQFKQITRSEEEIELINNAKNAGLFPYQVDGVEWIIDKQTNCLLALDMGLGKGHPIGTLIPTTKGLVPVEELKGKYVFGSDGKPTKVTAIHRRPKQRCVRLFWGKKSIVVDLDHIWTVGRLTNSSPPVKYENFTTRQLIGEEPISYIKGEYTPRKANKLFLPQNPGMFFENDAVDFCPYMAGLLLGDGCLSGKNLQLTICDQDWDFLKDLIEEPMHVRDAPGCKQVNYTNERCRYWQSILGSEKSINKKIPDSILFGTFEDRYACLQGLMDSDGSSPGRGRAVFNSCSKQLAENVCFLVDSLGGQGKIACYDRMQEGKRIEYRVDCQLPYGMSCFRLPRKSEPSIRKSRKNPSFRYRWWEEAGEFETVCITVEADNSLYLTKEGLVTHNTVTTIASLPKNGRVLVVSPTQVVINWTKEINRWRPEYKTYIVKGSKNFRFPEEGELVSVSYSSLPKWLMPEGKKRTIDLTEEQKEVLSNTWIIYDEIQALSNSKSQKSKKCKMLTKYSKRAIGLTGTPLKNKPLELYNILSSMGLAKEVFDSFFNFVRLFGGRKGHFGWIFDGEISPEVPTRLRKIMLIKKKSDPSIKIQLPSKTYIPIETKTSAKTKKIMDSAWDLYKEASGGDLTQDLPDITEMMKAKNMIAQDNLKTSLAEIELYESTETPLVFGSAHRGPVLEVGNRPGWGMIIGGMSATEKQEVVEKFQNGELKGIAVSLLAGNSGITLTKASHLLFNDLDWTPNSNEQFEDRIARIGQAEKTVFIKYVVQDHPLMQHIYKLNYRKKKMAHDAISAVITDSDVAEAKSKDIQDFHIDNKKFLEQRKLSAKKEEKKQIHMLIDSLIGEMSVRYPSENTKRGIKKIAQDWMKEHSEKEESEQPNDFQIVKLFVDNDYFTKESKKILTSILS